jgi:hypothetical protein
VKDYLGSLAGRFSFEELETARTGRIPYCISIRNIAMQNYIATHCRKGGSFDLCNNM